MERSVTIQSSRLFLLVFSITLLLGHISRVHAQYTCSPAQCTLPECFCAGLNPPYGITLEEVPQFILITFDDAVTGYSESLINSVFYGVTNPNGRTAPRTYFVTRQYSEPALIRDLYEQGHEFANHTATHETGLLTDRSTWLQQINALEDFLVQEAGIPSDQVVGFRAPYLASNEAMWEALQESGYLYDSSVTEKLNETAVVSTGVDAYVWPHTLDNGHALTCGPEKCPTTHVPGLWTIPMWVLYSEEGDQQAVMDPAVISDSLFKELLQYNFQRRYEGNRAPLGLFLHAGQMWKPERQQILRSFLVDKLARPEVWMITMRGLIEWMKAPVPALQMEAWFAAGCYRGSCNTGTNTGIESRDDPLPGRVVLFPNFPNPFNSSTTFRFDIAEVSDVRLEVYDVLGRQVSIPVRGTFSPGYHEVSWNPTGLPGGIYIYRLISGTFVETQQLVLLK